MALTPSRWPSQGAAFLPLPAPFCNVISVSQRLFYFLLLRCLQSFLASTISRLCVALIQTKSSVSPLEFSKRVSRLLFLPCDIAPNLPLNLNLRPLSTVSPSSQSNIVSNTCRTRYSACIHTLLHRRPEVRPPVPVLRTEEAHLYIHLEPELEPGQNYLHVVYIDCTLREF
jgi:hypothetical protein